MGRRLPVRLRQPRVPLSPRCQTSVSSTCSRWRRSRSPPPLLLGLAPKLRVPAVVLLTAFVAPAEAFGLESILGAVVGLLARGVPALLFPAGAVTLLRSRDPA